MPEDVVSTDETEGHWSISNGSISPKKEPGPGWAGEREELTYNNPFNYEIERVWFEGKEVFAVELGEIEADPETLDLAQEYQVVYEVHLDDNGKPKIEPERVPGQLNIYDSIPGMEKYSPLWQFNYVVVPREYEPNTLRSEADCLNSGYPIYKSKVVEN